METCCKIGLSAILVLGAVLFPFSAPMNIMMIQDLWDDDEDEQ